MTAAPDPETRPAADQPEPTGRVEPAPRVDRGDPEVGADHVPDALPDGRGESVDQRMDRNWNELLQELRVTQTGTQILTGFLLTLPFQQRFETLDAVQRGTYLSLVLLAVLATALVVAPVALHRALFRRRLKPVLVHEADLLARTGLAVLALVLVGTTFFLVDVVTGRVAAVVAGAAVALVLLVLWLLLPRWFARRAPAARG